VRRRDGRAAATSVRRRQIEETMRTLDDLRLRGHPCRGVGESLLRGWIDVRPAPPPFGSPGSRQNGGGGSGIDGGGGS
jgi:hypothetical protein